MAKARGASGDRAHALRALQKIHAEEGLRAVDSSVRVDLEENLEPGAPVREREQHLDSDDPELRADDETPRERRHSVG